MASMPPYNPQNPQAPPPGYPPPGYPPPPPGYQQGYPPQQPYPPQKKSNAVVWILGILGGLVLLFILAVGGGIYFLKYKMNRAGVDAELFKRNPTLAAARLAAALNPNIEVVGVNEGRQVLTVRDKKTGKVFTVNFEDAQHGRWTMTADGKTAEVNASGDGTQGSLNITSPDGSVRIGGGAATNVPPWVPQYPGSKPQNAMTSNQMSESGGMFSFKTTDDIDRVMQFYRDHITSAGLHITNTTNTRNNGVASGVLAAEDDGKNRTVAVVISNEGGENSVAVTYTMKK